MMSDSIVDMIRLARDAGDLLATLASILSLAVYP